MSASGGSISIVILGWWVAGGAACRAVTPGSTVPVAVAPSWGCPDGIVKLFENGWGAVVVGDSEAVMCWLAVGFHAAAAAVISSQTSKRSAISLRHWGALTR